MTTAAPLAADLVIRGRCVVDDQIALTEVGVRGGLIVSVQSWAVARAASPAVAETQVVELAADEVLLPGLVDTHVHVNEPGRTDWEGFDSATRAAAAGGVTTIVDMPLNSVPPTIDPAALDVKRRATEGKRHTDVGFWAGAVPSSLGWLRALHDDGVYGFKCFLADSGVAEFPALDHAQLDDALAEVASFGGLLIVHAEDAQVLHDAPSAPGRRYGDFLASRPPVAETTAIEAVLVGAAKHRTRVHILHLSCGAALDSIRRARAAGVQVSAETCPHYLTLTADEIADGQTQFKCCPPIRGSANREQLWQGLADGVIDCIVSDHSPSTLDLKLLDSGDFSLAWGGISSLQLGLPLIWTEARSRGFDLAKVASWMACRPAEIAGVAGKGRVAVGYDADFAVVAPDESFVVDVHTLHHKNPISPYDGSTLSGVVRQTWLRGQLIHSTSPDQPVAIPSPFGRLLSRGET